MDRRTFIGAAGAAALAPTVAAAQGADWSEDIAILRRAYTLMHPGLYRYGTPEQVDRRLHALERTFAAGPSLPDAYLALSRFLGTVRCGHTYANFYNQSDKVSVALFDGRTRTPFYFRLLGDRMVVTKNQSGDARLAPGTEILAIDRRTPRDLVRALLPFARADGGNDFKRRALLEVRGDDPYETFDIFHGLLFPVRDGAFDLNVRRPGASRAERFQAAAIDLAARRAGRAAERPDGAPLWSFAVQDGVSVLTMPSWVVYKTTWDWRAYLADVFAQLRGARALIVDLRGNEGGNDCGDEILARLIDRDLRRDGAERRVRFRTTPADLDPYLDTWDRSFRRLGVDARDVGGGFFALPEEGGDPDLVTPKGPRFTGRVLVLTDAQNSSAVFQFTQAIQGNGLGRLVGGPTGGNRRGINGGAFFFLRLPKSGLEVDLPLIGRFPKTPQPDAGLLPDVAVEDTAEDIAAGRDAVMVRAMALARA